MFWRQAHPAEAELTALADGELASGARSRVESHVAGCEACRGALDELRQLKASLATLPRASAPRSFALRRADVEATPAARAQPRGAPALLGGLAMVALVTFVTLVAVDVSNPSSGDSGAGSLTSSESNNRSQADSAAEPNEAVPAASAGDTAAEGGVAPSAPTAEAKAVDEAVDNDGGSDVPLRAAEAGTAALAVVAGGVFVWWREASR